MKRLKCDMAFSCPNEVTHIGAKGYIYCKGHGEDRRRAGIERTRMLRPWELEWLRHGLQLPSYRPGRKPANGQEVLAMARAGVRQNGGE